MIATAKATAATIAISMTPTIKANVTGMVMKRTTTPIIKSAMMTARLTTIGILLIIS